MKRIFIERAIILVTSFCIGGQRWRAVLRRRHNYALRLLHTHDDCFVTSSSSAAAAAASIAANTGALATHLQRLAILDTTDPPLDVQTTDPLQVMLYVLRETLLS